MKKILAFGLAATLLFSLSACGANQTGKTPAAAKGAGQTQGVNDILNNAVNGTSGAAASTANTSPAGGAAQSTGDVNGSYDIDLTQLSSTMVYSEVQGMMITPEDYLGKTVKMRGAFRVYQDEASGNTYYACIIADATACCAKGIEFRLAKPLKYPEEYPALDTTITVAGTFGTYSEDDNTYCQLTDAAMAWA